MSGDFGILADHVPTIAALKPGVVAVTDEKGLVSKYFGKHFIVLLLIESGFSFSENSKRISGHSHSAEEQGYKAKENPGDQPIPKFCNQWLLN